MPTQERRAGVREDSRSGPKAPVPSGVLSPGHIAEIQRQRLLAAMAEVAAERGAANVTVAHVVSRAGVSRRTFYELFEDRDDCFMAACDQALARAAAAVVPAYESTGRWRERVRATLAALLAFFDEEPGMARLLVVEALGASPPMLARRAQILDALIAAVDGGRAEAKPGKGLPSLTAEGVVGAVLSVLHARLLAGTDPLLGLCGELAGMVVLPYLGQAAAARELARPPVRPEKPSGRADVAHPLEGLNMRLTYRTLRVLATIGLHPGASNRGVADLAGISDQGQISKLLARLQDLGLIHNTGQGHPKGGSNAWRLTPKGQRIAEATGA